MSNIHTTARGEIGQASGIFSRSEQTHGDKPLVVLVHGGGTNSQYFDNNFHSIPRDFNQRGYDVLNVNRVGYGGNPLPTGTSPIFDSIPIYINLIREAYDTHGGKGGIILFGHSLGGVTTLLIASTQGHNLPILGVSALGSIPTKLAPESSFLEAIRGIPGDRVPVNEKPNANDARRFLGIPEYFDEAQLPRLIKVLEAGVKTEYLEWIGGEAYERFVESIARIDIPVQYLAAEIEIHWDNIEEGQETFDKAVQLFVSASRVDSGLLKGGAHDFEFSTSAQVLADRRFAFAESL